MTRKQRIQYVKNAFKQQKEIIKELRAENERLKDYINNHLTPIE